jgi:hypothetical protein
LWNGGPGDSSDWYLSIGPDGSWGLTNDYLGLQDSGYVDASGNVFSMSNEAGDATVADAAGITGCDWQIVSLAGLTQLHFCEGDLGPLSAWVQAG